jgi:preprotein translocase subunit SecY
MVDQAAAEPQLSNEELRAIRIIIKNDDRVRWFWSTARIFIAYAAATITFFAAFWSSIVSAIKKLAE